MVPTAIENRRGKLIRVIGEDESPGIVELGEKAFVSVKKHPKKPGHRLSRVARFRSTAGVPDCHIGSFATHPKPIGRGYRARWISEEDAARLANKK